jgi:hypothetical protein
MRRAFAALFAVSFSSVLLSAQSATWPPERPGGYGVGRMESLSGQGAQITAMGQLFNPACPVSMHAQHRSDGNVVRTQSAHPKGTGQWLHLTLAGADSKQITKATLTVYGVSPKAHLLQYAAKGQDASSEMTLTSTVPFVASDKGSFSTDFWVPGMTAVQLIDLKSIQYGDGSAWNLANGQSCQVKPDLFMLVSN